MCFFQAENAPKPFSAGAPPRTPLGELTTPRPLSRLGRGTPPLNSPPPRRLWRLDLGAFGASLLAPSNPNSWVRPCLSYCCTTRFTCFCLL